MKTNLLEYLEETVEKYPDRIAVIQDKENEICFRKLVENSKRLSCIISKMNNGALRKPIAVFMKKSIYSVLSDIGIIYSGNAFMNLDIKTPMLRINSILKLINPSVIITDNENAEILKEIWPQDKTLVVDLLDFSALSFEQKVIDTTFSRVIDTDPLCIINTSGSTGTPKGVVLNHKSFFDFTEWALNTMSFSNNEIIGCLSPFVFDIYVFEMCLLMSIGASMILIDENLAAFPVRILQLLNDRHVTFIFWVPTIMVNIANMKLLERISLPDIKLVWFAGEVFPTRSFNYWRKFLIQAKFVNMYGPIEITLDCTYYIIERELKDNEPIPIGFPCKNTDIIILNENNRQCLLGEEGELCVRGTSLAMGYYNNPEKTAMAFVQNPLNQSYPELIYKTGDIAVVNNLGEIIFKGRKDTLIKHAGYRIELTEIEHVIVNSLQIVRNGCVIYNYDKKEIILYYEMDGDTTLAELKKNISRVLPKYMIPTKYIRMDELPRNTNGKIDRLCLRKMTDDNSRIK